MVSTKERQPNKLVNEKSPYLLQHAYNPVNWYPWSEEAFNRAKEENKPIFLSIGYSTCHWCHVMEEESFEDRDVADLMNDTFVSIKVDREERPDIDAVYMEVAQLITGRGGWPLTIIMTPDKKPFVAATYIPKEDRYGQRGMITLIPIIKELWNEQRDKIDDTINQIHETLLKSDREEQGSELDNTISLRAFSEFSKRFDEKYGGFNIRPKFPSPHNLMFLLRYWKRTGDDWALHMVEKTVTEMRKGGIFDQIGFGFHRYSTDEEWLLPHFEKMLYDQAMMMYTLAELYQATHNSVYAKIIREIYDYLQRHLIDKKGGFYSAEDADSEGVEGKFYLWSTDQIYDILDDKESKLFVETYNLQEEGNFRDEAIDEKTGNNIPYLRKDLSKMASSLNEGITVLDDEIDQVRRKVLTSRNNRIKPHLDDKILTDWNGLMIAALSKAARVLNDENLLQSAINAIEFILHEMYNEKILCHRYRDGEVTINGFLDDYAFLAWALLELYETTFQMKYLKLSKSIIDIMIDQFLDTENGGFYFSGKNNEELLVRKMDAYDGAIPSGNSIAVLSLIRIARLLGDSKYETISTEAMKSFSRIIERTPTGFSMMLASYEFQLGKSFEIIIAGDIENSDTDKMLKKLRSVYLPNKIVLLRNNDSKTDLDKMAPYTKYYDALNEKATAHVCINHNCKLPTNDVEKMMELLYE